MQLFDMLIHRWVFESHFSPIQSKYVAYHFATLKAEVKEFHLVQACTVNLYLLSVRCAAFLHYHINK